MVMSLSECNLSSVSSNQLQSCLSDCQQRFPLRFFLILGPSFALNGDNPFTKISAHQTCNNWRWQSTAFTAVAIGTVVIGLAALLLSSKKQEAKPLPQNIVPVKPPVTAAIKQTTVSTSAFSIFKR